MSNLYAPPHPGELIEQMYLKGNMISLRALAADLQLAPSSLSRLIHGQHNITPAMALRLERVLGRSAQSWLLLQMNYDLWQLRREVYTLGR